jgi:hypothetical protein
MKEFELKLGAITYKCTSNVSTRDSQNWNIHAKFHDLELSMTIPEQSKVSMDKVMIFVTALDETLKRVQQEKGRELTFINQLA